MFWRTKKRSSSPLVGAPVAVGDASLGGGAEAGRPEAVQAAGGLRGSEGASAVRWAAATDTVAGSTYGGAVALLQEPGGPGNGLLPSAFSAASSRTFSLGVSDSESYGQPVPTHGVGYGVLLNGVVPNVAGAVFVVPKGYRVTGSICMVQSTIRVDGELAGRLLLARRVVVSSEATLRSPAEAHEVTVEGIISAPLKAQGHLEVRSGGQIRDVEVEAGLLTVLPGASLKGCSLLVGAQDDRNIEPHSVAEVAEEAA